MSAVAGRGKRVRDRQRAVHLVAGILLVASLYVPVEPGSFVYNGVRWVLVPVVMVAGILLWQWPAVRRLRRRPGLRRQGGQRPAEVSDNAA